MDPCPVYWRVKAAFLESRVAAFEARAAVNAANAKLAQALTDAGLDPQQLYHLHDEDETITPAPAGASLPPV